MKVPLSVLPTGGRGVGVGGGGGGTGAVCPGAPSLRGPPNSVQILVSVQRTGLCSSHVR